MSSFSLRAPAGRALAGVLLVAVLLVVGVRPASAQTDSPTETSPTFSTFVDRLLHGLRDTASGPEQVSPCPKRGPADDVPRLVVAIFECRLVEAGYPKKQVRRIVAEALVVSHCESLWDPEVVVFDGRYLDAPHPYTGYRYSAAGVFQFIRKTADKWIDGGYAEVESPGRDIDAAARLYLHNRAKGFGGWDDWACAAANDGFKVGSVLPGWPGGPEKLPDWVDDYVG